MREDKIEEAFGLAHFLRERVAEPTGLDYVLGLVSGSVRVTDEALQRRAGYHVALAEAHEAFGEIDAAANRYRRALEADPDCPQAHLGLARLRMPGASYLEHLAHIYAWAAPESVVQIGGSSGEALTLLLPPTIAIAVDPTPGSCASLRTQTHIFAETSDTFFERKRFAQVVGEGPLSIGFIDGSRSFGQALRDFIALEAVCGPKSLIIFSHTLPLDEASPSGGRANSVQSGDVWKTLVGLKRFRSDLEVFTIPTAPAGLSIVSNLNPHSRSLTDGYDEIVAEMTQVSLRSIRPDLYAILGVVPNDWSQIEARLSAFQPFAVE
jgi:hypothetical protein